MADNDTLTWSKSIFLKWSDFQAEHSPSIFEDSRSVIRYGFTWIVNSEQYDREILFFIENINLSVEFQHLLSSVRISESNETLLNHEQGHFDLAELLKRQNILDIQNMFYEKKFPTRGKNEDQRKQFAKEDSGKMIVKEIIKLEDLLKQRRDEYDQETNFGKNSDMQLQYDKEFNKLRL